MMRAALLSLILLAPALVGCLEVPFETCDGTECFPFDNDVLNELLSNPEALDVILLTANHERLRVESSTTYVTETQQGEIHWSVSKDDDANLRSIALRFSLGTTSIDTEVIEGTDTTNIRLGNVWYEGRDAVPEYKDPFFDIAQQATENPDGLWPSFGFDTTEIADLDWTITHDLESLEQIASARNATHSIILVLKGMPPKIVGIELYGDDDSAFVMTIETGDGVSLELQEDLPRSPIEFIVSEPFALADGVTVWGGGVPAGFTSEADPSELEFHGVSTASDGEETTSLAMMNFADLTTNITDDSGDWWAFTWLDYDSDTWFSSGDLYEIRTNSTAEVEVRIFDLWANSWTGERGLPNE